MIKMTVSEGWKNIGRMFENIENMKYSSIFKKYGELGLKAIKDVTPVRTGKTRDSWRYEILQRRNNVEIRFCNDNVQNGVNVALILNYGHATSHGGWVEGRHFIDPALQPIFDQLLNDLLKEVRS